jgi:hypothetical protein
MRIWLYDDETHPDYLLLGEGYFELQFGASPPTIGFIDTPDDRLALQRLVGGLTKLLERPLEPPKDFPDPVRAVGLPEAQNAPKMT